MLAPVELRHLRYFVCVADELHFTRAARRLRVAQPALSRQIRQLEEEIGVALFDRRPAGIQLTPAGSGFLAEARSILERSTEAIRAAQAHGPPRPAPLNLGYVWGLFHSVVPGAVEAFRRRQPAAAVNLFDQTATQQAEALAAGRLDAGFIGLAQEADAAGLARRRVGACNFVAALPLGHPAARRRKVPLPSLADALFFSISEDTYPGAARLVAEACSRAGFRPRIVQAADRGHTLLALVAGNCGVALVPESLAALPHPGVVLRPLTEPPRADLFVAWHSRRPHPLRDAFLESLESLPTPA